MDSLIGYPWNVLSMIIVHTLLQHMLKRLAHLLRINPPFDDVRFCRVLIIAIWVSVFELTTMLYVFFVVSMEASVQE
jgi:hypothetical protein